MVPQNAEQLQTRMDEVEGSVSPSGRNRVLSPPFERGSAHRARHAALDVTVPPACDMLHMAEHGSGKEGDRDAYY